VLKSVDDGATWSAANEGLGEARTLAVDPQTPSTVYAGTASGLFKSVATPARIGPRPAFRTTPISASIRSRSTR
jgi:hypothetical protein